MSINLAENNFRRIKSYVTRAGKITKGQCAALRELFPRFGIEFCEKHIDLNNCFGRNNPKIVELGFGMGQATFEIAKNNPHLDYLGIEVHLPGVGSLLRKLAENDLTNMRIINHDAVEVIDKMITDNTISCFHIFFPDPWPKKRHHKRRIIQTEFIELLTNKLIPNGYIHLATDWQEYADFALNLFSTNQRLINVDTNKKFIDRPIGRPLTKFEERGMRLGYRVYDMMFIKSN